MEKSVLYLIGIIIFNTASCYAHPITPTYFQLLNFRDGMFGYAYAAMALGMFLSSPFWGKITARINSRTAMALGSVGYGIGQMMMALGRTEGMVLAARFTAGISCGGFFVGSLTYIVHMSRGSEKGHYLTLNATVQTVATALGYFIGGMLGEVNLYFCFAIQIASLLLCGLMFMRLPEDATDKDLPLGQVLKDSNPFAAFMSVKTFMSLPLLILYIMAMSVFLGFTAVDQSFNYYLKDVFELTSSYNGIIRAAVGLISFAMNMVLGMRIMKNHHQKPANTLLIILAGCTLTLAIMMKLPLAFILLIVVFNGIYAVIVPIEQDMITTFASKDRQNEVLGFYQTSKSMGLILGAFLSGALYDVRPVFAFILGVCGFVLALTMDVLKRGMRNE